MNFNFLFLDDKNGKETLENSLSDKKKEATMDFAANIEKVREVIMKLSGFDLKTGPVLCHFPELFSIFLWIMEKF